jgi:hypothetical protein
MKAITITLDRPKDTATGTPRNKNKNNKLNKTILSTI